MPPTSEELRLVRDVATAFAPTISQQPIHRTPAPVRSGFHDEEAVPGVELQNYTKRVPSEDGEYVVVTEHYERIEKIRQPPTPEEIEAQRKDNRNAAIAVGTMFVGIFGFFGWLFYQESKQRSPQISQTTDEADKS